MLNAFLYTNLLNVNVIQLLGSYHLKKVMQNLILGNENTNFLHESVGLGFYLITYFISLLHNSQPSVFAYVDIFVQPR